MLKVINKLSIFALAGLFYMQPAMASPPPTVNINGSAFNSYGSDGIPDNDPGNTVNGINVVNTGNDNVNAFYNYTIYDGGEVNDTIPVRICMTGSSRTGWNSIAVSFGSASGNLPGVTLPANQTFLSSASTPDCRDLTITIASGTLSLADPNVAQNFNANFNLADTNPDPSTGNDKPNASFGGTKNFHIQVEVLPLIGSNVSCFITDSSGMFLADCDWNPVTESGSSDGRFAIVTNKKKNIEVATNPGQFYYNFIWFNTTLETQTVDVGFVYTGVIPHGTQALHAYVINGYLDPLTPEVFALANANGIPEGKDDMVSGVEVPAGASLLVTYHFTWGGLGAPVPSGCALTCEDANQEISVTATVSGDGIVEEECTSGAFGFKKF